MPNCAAIGCSNKPGRSDPGISFHKFPKEVDLKEAWVRNISREDFIPTASSMVCSLHFKKSCLHDCSTAQNHVYRLIKSVASSYFRIRMFHLGKTESLKIHATVVRKSLNKLVLFQHQ